MDLLSNRPFWAEVNGIVESYPSLKKDLECDILVIGGGITGSLIAHQCMEDGYKTVLLDRREIAHGSTAATTAMLQYETDKPLHELIPLVGEGGAVGSFRAGIKAIERIGSLADEIDSKAGFEKKKALRFAAARKDVRWLQKEYETLKKYGFQVEWLSAEEIADRFHLQKTFGGILSEHAASIDAYRFAYELLNFNVKRGLRVYDKTELKKVHYRDNHNIAETTTGKRIAAKRIIYCTGYEATETIKENFATLTSTYAIISERFVDDCGPLEKLLIWDTSEPYHYMRTTADRRILIGGEDERFKNAYKRDRLLDKKENRLRRYLKKILPEDDFYTDFAWAGTFAETNDSLPYIGRHRDFDNSYFVLGYGGNGITFSVIGMEMISAMLRGETHPLESYYRFGR